MTTYFTADPHLGHENIITTCKRPFSDVDAMNEALIVNWQSVVQPNDDVYVLGDAFYRCHQRIAQKLFDRLPGRKHLIEGNHDKVSCTLKGWASISHYHEMTLDGVQIVLSHYPFKTWKSAHWGSIQLYGHVHGSLRHYCNQIDAGVDVWDYRPVTLQEIMKGSRDKPFYFPEDYPLEMHDVILKRLDAVYERTIGMRLTAVSGAARESATP